MEEQSEHNDLFIKDQQENLKTQTNNSGGVQGGISNGMPLYFKVGFKPPSTIALPQHTYSSTGESQILEVKGRHDPCVVPRAVPIIECMSTLVIMNHFLMYDSYFKH